MRLRLAVVLVTERPEPYGAAAVAEPLSAVEMAEEAAQHAPTGSGRYCRCADFWPCTIMDLIATVAQAERDRDAYRLALTSFARAVNVVTLDGPYVNVIVEEAALERARELLAGEKES